MMQPDGGSVVDSRARASITVLQQQLPIRHMVQPVPVAGVSALNRIEGRKYSR